MSALPRVVLSEDISDAGKAVLRGRAELILAPDTTAATATRLLADADGLILRASTQITREVLSGATKLRIIARTGIGYDNVNLPDATAHGIVATNTPEQPMPETMDPLAVTTAGIYSMRICVTGACCVGSACVDVTEAECLSLAGQFSAPGVSCSAVQPAAFACDL